MKSGILCCIGGSLLAAALSCNEAEAATNRPDGYTTICKSDETCSVSQSTNVAFGAAGLFVYKVLNGTFVCSVDTFGSDPNPDKSVKECSIPSDGSSGIDDSGDTDDATTVTLTGSAGDGSVSLSWSGMPSDASSVQVYYDTDSDPSGRVRLASVATTTTTYTASGLTNGTTYWFWIKYLQSDGTYDNSNAYSATPASSTSVDPDGIVVDTTAEILSAVEDASAGDIIYVRAGTYSFSSTIELEADGTSSNPIKFMKYPSDSGRPVFNFSSMSESSSNRGFELSGNYWYIYGIDVKSAGDNGMFISGSYNTVEFSTFSLNHDTGLQIGNGGAYNLIKNVDSYYNADSSLENADGFAAKLDVGTGNKFYGCRAWNNLDDGYDGYLRGADNVTTTYENSWAIRNGYDSSNNAVDGDGNGFKTGGSDDKDLKHNAIYINAIAAGNRVDGFDHNSNRGTVTIYNSIAHNNGSNINFSSTNPAAKLTIKNTISYGTNGSLNATSTDITNNSWQDGHSATSADFSAVSIDELLGARKSDGSLPDVSYFHLIVSSDLIDAGVDVGLDYVGSAPDIGAFEYGQ